MVMFQASNCAQLMGVPVEARYTCAPAALRKASSVHSTKATNQMRPHRLNIARLKGTKRFPTLTKVRAVVIDANGGEMFPETMKWLGPVVLWNLSESGQRLRFHLRGSRF